MVDSKSGEGKFPPAEDSSELVNGIAGAVVAVATEGLLARTPLAKAAALAGATLGTTVAYGLGHSELGREFGHAFDGGEPNALLPDCLPQPHPIADLLHTVGLPVLGSPPTDPIGTPVLVDFDPAPTHFQPVEQDPARVDLQTVVALAALDELTNRGTVICDPPGSIDPVAELGGTDPEAPPGALV